MYQRKPRVLLRKSLTVCRYPACNSEIRLPLRPENHHAQPKSVIFKIWKQFSSRLALLQVPSQRKCLSGAGSGQLHCGVGGACVLSPGKATRGFFCAWQDVLLAICIWISISKVISSNKHRDVLQMVRTGTRRNNFDSFLPLIALPPN